MAAIEIEKIYAIALLAGLGMSAVLFVSAARFPVRFRLPFRARSRFMRRLSRPRGESSEHLPSFLPATIGIAVTGFGMFGLVLRVLAGLDALTSALVAAALSIALLGSLIRLSHRLLTSEAKPMEGGSLVGAFAQVCLEIPEGGVGSISYTAEGKRHTMPARAETAIPKGARVLVTNLHNRVAVVEEF